MAMSDEFAKQLLQLFERCQASLDRIEKSLDKINARPLIKVSELTFP